jgi:hypothetical protein
MAAGFNADAGKLLNRSVNSQFLYRNVSKDLLHFREDYFYRISVSKNTTERVL